MSWSREAEPPSMTQFAMEKMTEIRAEDFADEESFKEHIYALGFLAQRAPEQSRLLAKRRWFGSHPATPLRSAAQVTFIIHLARRSHQQTSSSRQPEV